MTYVFPSDPDRPRGLGSVLNALGAIVVGFWLFAGHVTGGAIPLWAVIVATAALVAWVARAYLREDLVSDIAVVVMVGGGAVTVQSTDALLITPAIIGVVAITTDRRHPIAVGGIFAVVAGLIVSATSLVNQRPASFLLGVLGGLALGFVVGYSRRQANLTADRERELLVRDTQVEREQQRSALLADRARIARDMHDVLAHSLGGLVIQLDAVDALLENGRIDDAAARVSAARELAAEGLGEARRAVATLRDPGAETSAQPDALAASDAVERLLTAHESLGGRAVVEGRAALDGLDAPHTRALAGVLREALSNVRRHAPGETVTITASTDRPRALLHLVVSNPVRTDAPAVASLGGGQGLPGMRERMAELGDGSRIDTRRDGDVFVLEATVPLSTREASA